ncbi:hypothetical protein RHSIM_Rhsim02G0175900 [Rhododendron simsii]|uniref:Retrotransposon Copia-like N-terminal domain-containing protein n=1 Tax=Rhododendron simsii TaxID=118357 RepID=A0A834HA69_RHOSS|nr:hypothetical protein RHSIM_Rhsim02G0175900 [Rhododendron simsii]
MWGVVSTALLSVPLDCYLGYANNCPLVEELRPDDEEKMGGNASSESDGEDDEPFMGEEKREEWRRKIREVEEDPNWPEDADGQGFNLDQFFNKISIKNVKKDDDENAKIKDMIWSCIHNCWCFCSYHSVAKFSFNATMTEVSGAKSPKKNESSPIVSGLHLRETSSLITLERLDNTNYVEWSLNARNKIRGRKRWGYISGTKAAPSNKKSEEYEEWEDENCLVKSWLLDAMTKDIRSLFLRLSTAKEIWEAVKNTYSVDQDASKAYQLHCEVFSVCQNGGSVISYFGKLQKIWQELDDIDACILECANDIAIYTTKVNSERVYKFLAGLDPHLDGVRGRVLSTKPLPDIQAAYAIVCSEANRQDAMLGENIGEGTGKKASHKEANSDPKANLATTHAFTAKSELEAFFTSENISSSGDSSGQGEFSDEREELSVVEPETSHTEDNALHDSTMPPNNSTQPLSQSSSEIPPEVSINPNFTYSDDLFSESQVSQYRLPPRSNRGVPPVKYEPDPKSKKITPQLCLFSQNDDSENEIVWRDDDYIRPIKDITTKEWEETVFKDISPLIILMHNCYRRLVFSCSFSARFSFCLHFLVPLDLFFFGFNILFLTF